MRDKRTGIKLTLITSFLLLGAPMTASAQMQCVVDFDGDGVVTTLDITQFIVLWTSGNSRADLNADGLVDYFDVNTAVAYAGFNPCPAFVDYQYNRVIDNVDGLFFNLLFALGSSRADLDGDGVTAAVDAVLFNTQVGMTY